MSLTSPHSLSAYNKNWGTTLVFLLGLVLLPLVSTIIIDHPPEYDELLHVLAARGVAETGQPIVADGEYPRAYWYTLMVSKIASSGENELIHARLPALLFGSLLVALAAAWVASKAGWIAGISTAGVLTLMPDTLHLSVVVRFYTVHALLMLLMLICAYEAVTNNKRPGRAILFFAGATLFFLLGMHFQVLSQVTLLGCVAGAVALLAFDGRNQLNRLVRQHTVLTTIVVVVLCAATVYLANVLNVYEKLRGVTPVWSIDKADDYFFYIKNLTPRLPMIWPLFPVLVLLAWVANRRMTVFFLTVFLICLIISSVASQKATRYVYHFAPVIAILCGLGLKSAIELCSSFVSQKLSLHRSFSLALALGLAAVCMLNTIEVQRVAKVATGKGTVDRMLPLMSEPDWLLAVSDLSPYLDSASTVIASSGIKSLYAFGRYDYELNRTVIDDTLTKTEFGFDGRTGRLVISTPDSLREVLAESESALIVAENRMINQAHGIPTETMEAIDEQCETVSVNPDSQLSAWFCNN